MTNEELLIPRVVVVALYPHSPFKIGDILQPIPDASNPWYGRIGDTWGVADIIIESEVLALPHLFKPLQWWECRDVKDLPEYVKWNDAYNGTSRTEVFKVDKWLCNSVDFELFKIHSTKYNNLIFAYDYDGNIYPATEAEYLEYLKSKQ